MIGGETAEMPGIYAEGDYDLAGFAVGAVERGQAIDGSTVVAGDVVLGLASSGLHSNGFSLVRRVVADAGLAWDDARALRAGDDARRGAAAADAALRDQLPRRASLRAGSKALAHITGGGLLENIPRVLPDGLACRARRTALDACRPSSAGLPRRGRVAPAELARTFNCGIGMVAIVAPGDEDRIAQILERHGERVTTIGRVEPRGDGPGTRIAGIGGGVARLKVGVLISGRGSNLASLIDACALHDFPAEISLVISNRADARGLAYAKRANIPSRIIPHRDYASREAFDAALDHALVEAGIELVCLAGFMRLLGDAFVARWRDRLVNIHPSLLPAFSGLDTHARALAAGVRFSGCTVHFVRPEMDSGPIIIQAAVPVLPGDDAETPRRPRACGRAPSLSAGAPPHRRGQRPRHRRAGRDQWQFSRARDHPEPAAPLANALFPLPKSADRVWCRPPQSEEFKRWRLTKIIMHRLKAWHDFGRLMRWVVGAIIVILAGMAYYLA